MRADAVEARVAHVALHLSRSVTEEARGLHFLITERGQFLERSLIVLRQQVTYRVELKADGKPQRGSKERARIEET